MVQNAIEEILRQKLGLDARSMGASAIARIIDQRQRACGCRDQLTYLMHLKSSPQELNELIEAAVVPETWFFRDQVPFDYLKSYATDWRRANPAQVMRILSAPCSTGEEPYSIAIALLEAGLTQQQFRVDAVDISKAALLKAERAIYRKNSFRGNPIANQSRYFESVEEGWAVRPFVRETVKFVQGNLVAPGFLAKHHYHVIFCRNLLIYLEAEARSQLVQALDQALRPEGLLFVAAVEIPQLAGLSYTMIDFASAYRKSSPQPSTSIKTAKPMQPKPAPAMSLPQPVETPSPLEAAKRSANQGQLTQARQLCESHLRLHPTDAEAYLLLGEIHQGLNQPNEAERCFHHALYLNPNEYEALIHLAFLKEQRGDRTAAEQLKQRAQRVLSR